MYFTKSTGIIALFIFSCVACTSGENQENHDHGKMSQNAAAVVKSPTDSLFELVLNYHDEAMPKIGKLRGYQQDAQHIIDSLAALKDAGSKKLKKEFEGLLAGLQRADKGMMDWMDEFTPEPDLGSTDSLMKYYESELIKAKMMRDDIFNVLDTAAIKIGPK